MAIVEIPSALQKQIKQPNQINVEGRSVKEVLNNLIQIYPLLKPYVFDRKQELCAFVAFYVNNRNIAELDQEKTRMGEMDVLTVLPAIAGG